MQIVQGKTVVMVTHRKALLSLMDTIYVLENGQLRNVKELGGLDYYLALLEGIDQKKIEEEIKDEKAYVKPDQIESFLGLLESPEPEVIASVTDNKSADVNIKEDGEVTIKLH